MMQEIFPVDRLILSRYKLFLSKSLAEYKNLKEQNKKLSYMEKFKKDFFQIVKEDGQVFLQDASIQAFLDRYVSKKFKV